MNRPGRPSPPIAGKNARKRPPSITPLSLWLKANQKSQCSLARDLGCDPKLVKLWTTGRVIPGLVYAFKIERQTEGGVPASSWLGTPLGREMWNTTGNKRWRSAEG